MTDRFPGVKFAIFTLLCLVAAGYIISITGNIRRLPFVSETSSFEAVLDNASGLYVGDDVRLSGVPVGRVQGISIEQGNAVIAFQLDEGVEIRDTWEVGARWRNIIGQRFLYLYKVGDGAALEPGDRIPVERSRPVADVARFFNEITPLLEAIDPEQQNKLLNALNTSLDTREGTVQELVRDFSALSNTLADEEPAIRSVLDQGSTLLAEYNQRDEQFRAFFTDLASVGDVLAVRNDEFLGAISDITEVQRQLGGLVQANDEELSRILDDLSVITGSIGEHRSSFEEALGNTRDGLAVYNLISRWGQWFNVRAVAFQTQENGQVTYCQTENNVPCSAPNSRAGAERQSTALPTRADVRLAAADVVIGSALGEQPGDGLALAALQAGLTGTGARG